MINVLTALLIPLSVGVVVFVIFLLFFVIITKSFFQRSTENDDQNIDYSKYHEYIKSQITGESDMAEKKKEGRPKTSAEYKEKYEKQIKFLDKFFSIFSKVLLVLAVLVILFSNYLAKNVFYSEKQISYTESEPYTQTKKVSTYVCYVTDYGSNYHEYGCQYLWNSAYRTTVYEAKQEGYTKCSKCSPTTPTTAYIEVDKYEDVTKYRYEKKPASSFLVTLIGESILVGLFFLVGHIVDKIKAYTTEKISLIEKESRTNEIDSTPLSNHTE